MALVGRIARAHGIRGQVIVNLETDFPEERFRPGAELFVERDGDDRGADADERPVSAGPSGHRDCGRRDDERRRGAGGTASCGCRSSGLRRCRAARSTGTTWSAAGSRRRPANVGRHGRETSKARWAAAGWWWTATRGEVLIPLAAEICTTIDPAAKRIVIDPPEGLLDLNADRAERTDVMRHSTSSRSFRR